MNRKIILVVGGIFAITVIISLMQNYNKGSNISKLRVPIKPETDDLKATKL